MYIKHVLESIVNFSDQIIILEGAWNPELPNRSTDGTINTIQEFQKANKEKTTIIYYNSAKDLRLPKTNTYQPIVLANELRAKQQALDVLTGDWFMLVDSDEIYDPEQLNSFKEYLEELSSMNDVIYSFSIPAFVFYFNYYFGTEETFHRVTSVKEWPPKIDYTDTLINSKNLPVVHDTLDKDMLFMYHYGYIGEERVKTKLSMWDKEHGEDWFENIFKPIAQNPEILKEGNNYHLFNKIGYGKEFVKFKGNHPKIMRGVISFDK